MKDVIKRASFVICVCAVVLTITNVFAYSGRLDDYDGTGFTDAGKLAVDSFSTKDGKIFLDHYNGKMGNPNGGVKIQLRKKNWLGQWNTNVGTAYAHESREIAFNAGSAGTYRLWFAADGKYTVDFHGTVWDNK